MFPKLSILTQRAALRRGRCFLFSQFLKPLPVGRLQNEKRPFTEKQTALRFIFQLVFSSSLSIPKGWASLKAAPSESLNYEDREEVSPLWTRRVLYRKENSFSSSSSSLFSSGPWTYLSRSLRGETISSPRDFFFYLSRGERKNFQETTNTISVATRVVQGDDRPNDVLHSS